MSIDPGIPGRAPRPSSRTLAELGSIAVVFSGDSPSIEIEALFRADRGLRAVVIDVHGTLCLLTRDQVDDRMTGRLGYGRALNTRVKAAALLPKNRFIVEPSMDLRTAAAVILGRPEETRYEDLLVPSARGPRIVPVSEVFEGLSEAFEQDALHDPLTGLANRRLLDEHGPALVGAAGSSSVAVLYIDLDDFKIINDTFGHRIGDAVLSAFAARLQTCTRPADLTARIGGDEFAVLLVDVDESTARAIAARFLETLENPFTHDGHELHLSATLGLAMAADVDGENPAARLEYLLRHADTAMLQAKHDGKRRLGRIDPCRPPTRFARQALIRRRLPHALATSGLTLVYQPLMDIATGACGGAEALLRWEDPDLGRVGPDEFIHVAEHTGEIHAIGRWVIDQACAQARRWSDAGTPRAISVNISPVQLSSGTLVPDLLAALRRYGLPASLLNIEITETAAVADLRSAAAQLRELTDVGIGVALDDYGTAYSSLAMLRDLPLTCLKLDKSFIDTIDSDPVSAILVSGVIAPAKALGLTTTAEGVERQTQLAILQELGCDTAQGYLISRPLPADQLDAVLRAMQANAACKPTSEQPVPIRAAFANSRV
ncbi:putative bifunctional diguanylate cyclase/phosphodiesterase [Arthrobacter sp. YAF17]|uniref:putative bifunctional diguanylate cyclase/phosphodiesterase n=1 Tax=Arthrobacter sp. YAF17 TaxID=3233077 RepID=UPI003F907A0C